jgi:simple sugar transport system permease protein
VIWFNTNQYATGLALSLFGAGFSAFVGLGYVQAKLPELPKYSIPGLADLPLVGPALFTLHPLVYGAIVLAALMVWFLYRTRAGLVLRSVGESPSSAHALGYPVRRIRLMAVMFGGAMCGLAGAFISVVYTPLWVENMVSGRGWIALALTTFATWRPARVLLGAYLFGGVTMLQFHLQATGSGAQPDSVHAAVSGHHRGAGADLAQSDLDSSQYAGLPGKALLPWSVMPKCGAIRFSKITRGQLR